jgi:integrase
MGLMRWFRFCWAAGLEWDQVTRAEADDFCRWLLIAGRPRTGVGYAPATAAHCETVLRHFYDFHLEVGTGPMVSPFPLARGRGRSGAHHNPMDPFLRGRSGLFRPKLPQPAPRSIPDEQFSELFARLGSHRDRALVAFWVSTGARASELLGATAADADPGRRLITVVRKGTRAMQQQLPTSPDAFVWLRLYQEQMRHLVPEGPDQPL